MTAFVYVFLCVTIILTLRKDGMMKKKRSIGIFFTVAAVCLVLSSVGNAPAFAGQTTDEILAKKYANILGSYTYEGTDAAIEFVIR